MTLSRRTLLAGGAVGLAAAAGTGALLLGRSGPILDPPPTGTGGSGYLVAAYQPGPLSWRVLDPRTGRYVPRDGSYTAPSPDLRYVLAYDAQQLSMSSRILDTANGAVVHDFGRAWNLPLGWSPDGRHVVLGGTTHHRVGGREDDYFTVDRLRVVAVATGRSRTVAPWKPVHMADARPWWTADGRLVYADRLIAMDGRVAVSRVAVGAGIPVLGTNRAITVAYGNRAYLTGPLTVDPVAGTTATTAPGEITAELAGIDYSGLRWLAWLDDDRIIGLRDHDIAAYDVHRGTRQVFATFPDDVVLDALIAPATGLLPTVR